MFYFSQQEKNIATPIQFKEKLKILVVKLYCILLRRIYHKLDNILHEVILGKPAPKSSGSVSPRYFKVFSSPVFKRMKFTYLTAVKYIGLAIL